jgi:Got1/Sft2-like family
MRATLSRFCSVPTGMQFAYFAAFMAAGIFFLAMAFLLFLPVIILAPAKFASSFTMGSVLIMAAFTALKGWRQQLTHMFSKERLPFSAGESPHHCVMNHAGLAQCRFG